jgi:hypothetical protein
MSRTALCIALVSITLSVALHAQQTVLIEGTVTDAETSKPIPGASIRVVSTKRGTYSSPRGTFRLPLPPGRYELLVTSIGYREQRLSVSTESPRVSVVLQPSSVQGEGVEVVAEPDADQIVRRAIERKDDNLRKVKTFQGLLYSKFMIEIEGNAFGALKESDRQIILETFSRNYYNEQREPRIVIIQRRQTANIPAQDNLFAFGQFFSFYDDDIRLLNATVPSPLNADALSRYNFSLIEKTTLNDSTVYVIGVRPATSVLPAFEGTMKIVKGTYSLVEVDLAPSKATAISFVQGLRFVQKFERFQEDIWQPTYLQVTGSGRVTIVKGLAEIDANFTATSIFTEAQVNTPIPDSIYRDKEIITAAPQADTARSEFWESNSLSELTLREKEIYQRVDSLVVAEDTTGEHSSFSFGYGPYIDFNRVGSVSLGATLSPRIGPVRFGFLGAYSLGLQRPVGNASVAWPVLEGDDLPISLTLEGALFSMLETMTLEESIPRLFNTVAAAAFHRDYYDYMRQDGWNVGVRATMFDITLRAQFENSRQFPEEVHTDRSIFIEQLFRPNPAALAGEFNTLRGDISMGNPDAFLIISSSESISIRGKLTGLMGEHTSSGRTFRAAEGGLIATVPTFGTGYLPMTLKLGAWAGTGKQTLPTQYQFRMPTSVSVVGRFGQFYSAPTGIYGGTEYVALHAEHNFSDLLWRFLHLPTFDGRGIEIIGAAAAGRFRQGAITGYLPTGDEWYMEAGFGLGKIPLFITNVFSLRFDARWGLGPLGSKKFGAVLGISSPF